MTTISFISGFIGVGFAALFFGLVLLAGLGANALFGDSLRKVQHRMLEQPLEGVAIGVATKVLGGALAIGLMITILGIPLGLLLLAVLGLSSSAGLLAALRVVGAALPFEGLRGRPEAQIAAGTLALSLASLIPVVGGLIVGGVASWGMGSMLQLAVERRRKVRVEGPYRTAADRTSERAERRAADPREAMSSELRAAHAELDDFIGAQA